jgi:hypothetical protein
MSNPDIQSSPHLVNATLPDTIHQPLAASPSLAAASGRSVAKLAESRGRTLAQRSLTQRVFELIHAADARRFDRRARWNSRLRPGRGAERL